MNTGVENPSGGECELLKVVLDVLDTAADSSSRILWYEGQVWEVWDSLGGCRTSGESWGYQARWFGRREARTPLPGLNLYLSWLECTSGSPGRRLESNAAGVRQTESCASPRSRQPQEMLMRQCRCRFQHQKENFHKPRQALTKSICGKSCHSSDYTNLWWSLNPNIDDIESCVYISTIDISSTRSILLDRDWFPRLRFVNIEL